MQARAADFMPAIVAVRRDLARQAANDATRSIVQYIATAPIP